jgi:hypothetical protein
MLGEEDLEQLRAKQDESQEPFWLLGESYTGTPFPRLKRRLERTPSQRNCRVIPAKQQAARRLHIHTIFKCTYRSGFPAIEPYRITDDAGWGCMLRSAQMLMANVWIRQLLGRGNAAGADFEC